MLRIKHWALGLERVERICTFNLIKLLFKLEQLLINFALLFLPRPSWAPYLFPFSPLALMGAAPLPYLTGQSAYAHQSLRIPIPRPNGALWSLRRRDQGKGCDAQPFCAPLPLWEGCRRR